MSDAPIETDSGPNPKASVIWLHGLGADGHDFAGLVPELRLPKTLPIRFISPHAPFHPVTINNGYVMRAWYDIAFTEKGVVQNETHILASVATVHSLIQGEIKRGIAGKRIVVAGFSQGGTIALYSGLGFSQPLGGIIALSSHFPAAEKLLTQMNPANADIPIFLAHGKHDAMIPFAHAQQMHTTLQARRMSVEWHAYPIEHTVSQDEIRDIAQWLMRVLQ